MVSALACSSNGERHPPPSNAFVAPKCEQVETRGLPNQYRPPCSRWRYGPSRRKKGRLDCALASSSPQNCVDHRLHCPAGHPRLVVPRSHDFRHRAGSWTKANADVSEPHDKPSASDRRTTCLEAAQATSRSPLRSVRLATVAPWRTAWNPPHHPHKMRLKNRQHVRILVQTGAPGRRPSAATLN